MATKLENLNAAGIDVSSTEHLVAVREDSAKESVRTFQGFTRNLHQLARWLKECGVDTIAMESSVVYWLDLYTILLDYDFEVYLVNAYHVKNVPGRKSAVSDTRCKHFICCALAFNWISLPGLCAITGDKEKTPSDR
ncbi:transposase [Aequorivita sp. Q41]|uniref:IS110 family transposase n=1 Tax=Aequorivita sp. Q41 TaxID=3153300 RepID=UPI003241F06C